MSGNNFIMNPISWDKIRAITDDIRKIAGVAEIARFPVVRFLEETLCNKLTLVEFEVLPKPAMGPAEGLTCHEGKFIRLREDVYEAACEGEGRARFTVAHELGHLFLHAGQKPQLARAGDGIKAYRLSEPQANQFAAELLMPRKMLDSSSTPRGVADAHGVSVSAAVNRIKFMSGKNFEN